MSIKHRNVLFVFVMTFVTLGIYAWYWTVKTKNEIKSLGADIPTALLALIPFVSIYFWYKYLVGYNQYVKKGSIGFLIFLFIFFPFPIGMIIVQDSLNDLAAQN